MANLLRKYANHKFLSKLAKYLITLKSGKQEVKEIRAGQECGLKVSCRRPILVNDEVRFFTVERRERKLDLKV